MPERRYNRLPINALVSFEAAARLVSFKTAADELNVTPAAISHQVKPLERELQCDLFQRHHRGVDLTETGAVLLVAIQRGLDGLTEALDQIRAQSSSASVNIRSTAAVSSLWLTPRLSQFWKAHGQVSVTQIVSDTDQDQSNCDMSIHYGDMPRQSGTCRALFNDRIMALSSPRFAQQYRIERVEDLAQLPLVHLEAAETDWTTWRKWLHALG